MMRKVLNLILKDFDLLLISWIVLNGGCFITVLLYYFQGFVPRSLHGLFRYGKTLSNKKTPSRLEQFLYVPNR